MRKDIQALTSWGTDESWEVTLEFDADADSYRITKSFKDKVCELAVTGAHEFVATYPKFVLRLGLELSKTISLEEAQLEYVPLQYLCEFIKQSGFDGVI